jgi:hypothetical protein
MIRLVRGDRLWSLTLFNAVRLTHVRHDATDSDRRLAQFSHEGVTDGDRLRNGELLGDGIWCRLLARLMARYHHAAAVESLPSLVSGGLFRRTLITRRVSFWVMIVGLANFLLAVIIISATQ